MNKRLLSLISIIVLASLSTATFATDVHRLTMEGDRMKAKDVPLLEKKISEDPNDILSRTKLLGYYCRKQYQNQSAREAIQKHVLWLIMNAPESEVLGIPEGSLDAILNAEAYAEGKKAWIDQIKKKPMNLKVLKHSSKFFQIHDRELAKKSLQMGQSLDSDDPKWPAALGHLYMMGMITNSSKKQTEAARKALEQFETAYKLSTKMGRDPLLQFLTKTALAANDLKKAKGYAEMMLSQNSPGWNYGNNIHHANIVLGRIAIRSDHIQKAKEHLIKAGETPGSPQLNSFGPNMTLAKELLQKGEKEVVLKYFELCSKFWKSGKERLDKWSADVKDGKMPNFGTNLSY